MKKLLLILLCVPLIGLGQDNCGDEPTNPKKTMSQSIFEYKQTKEYKTYKKQKDDWDLCQALNKELLDSNALYKQAISIDDKSNKYIFEEVVKTPNFTPEKVYALYREWFVTTFVNAEAVLQMDDKESGVLIGKSFTHIATAGGWFSQQINFTLKIYIREGRFKYVLTDFYLYTPPSKYISTSTTPLEDYDLNNLSSFYNRNGKKNKSRVALKENFILEFTDFGEKIKSYISKIETDLEQNQQDDW